MNNKRPLILVTNDDGHDAEGIKVLTDCVRKFGDVVVFAPDSHQSGMSAAITSAHALRVRELHNEEGLKIYNCSGTPVDCVKLALNRFLPVMPDLLVSGINHGSNAGVNVIYSGTVAAAMEGAICGVPSIAFSLCGSHSTLEYSMDVVEPVVSAVLKNGLPEKVCLNVNFPDGKLKGIKVTSQTHGRWVNEFYPSKDGFDQDVYWISGNFENAEKDNQNSDEWAINNGFAAIVPINIDFTDYDFLKTIQHWKF